MGSEPNILHIAITLIYSKYVRTCYLTTIIATAMKYFPKNWWKNCHKCICIVNKLLTDRSLIVKHVDHVPSNMRCFRSLSLTWSWPCLHVSDVRRHSIWFSIHPISKSFCLRNHLIIKHLPNRPIYWASPWAPIQYDRRQKEAIIELTATRFVYFFSNDDIDGTCANDKWRSK